MSFPGLNTCPSLIITDCCAGTCREVIEQLADLAQDREFVNEIFKEKIWEREIEFPTGLPTAVPIAIPHVHDGCLRSFFSMAVMRNPVEFQSMDGSEEPIGAKIVFLFGITDPSQQTAVLRRFCTIFQNSELLENYISAENKDLLIGRLKEDLGDFIIL